MIAILVAADNENKDFWDGLLRLIDRHFCAIRAIDGKLTVPGEEPSLVICDTQGFAEINAEKVIVIYKKAQPLAARIKDAVQVVAVVDSSDDDLLKYVSATRLPAIICGMQNRDTITLSSMDEESVVIDIQRTITCFDGSKAEPQEIPVRFEQPLHRFALMAMTAIIILSGNGKMLSEGKM